MQIREKFDGSNVADVRRSIAGCKPVPNIYPLLWRVAQTVSKSDAIEKSRLFLKPQEFVSEIGKMRKSSEYVGEGHDIVSKAILVRHRPTRVCVRCGGKSQQHEISLRGDGPPLPGTIFSQWHAWRRRWWTRCICGGRWVRVD
ncbi:hypothetical protein BC826DRAFT_500674 [Russula brevipes]|nr:hypothetical protein BC826DRAFT_500674 [Russula brevipes]